MISEKWKQKIIKQMQDCGVYNESFESGIDALADILEERDRVKKEYEDGGSKATVIHTLDRGAKNAKMNPLLKIWMDLNNQALAYWRELGLTSRSYKSMTGSLTVQEDSTSLEEVLAGLGI